MIKHNYKGLFIAFEGLDGSGKTTQVNLLARSLREKGKTVLTTNEPTNNLVGGLIRGVLTKQWQIPAEGLQLLYAADRSHHLDCEINPNLEKGNVVITDRYAFSSIAFGSIDVSIEWLKEINKNFILPDVTFYIKISPSLCINRISKSRSSFELFEEEEKLRKTEATYELLAQDKSNNFIIIDGEKEIGDIEKEVSQIIFNKFGFGGKINSEKLNTGEARW